VHSILLNIQHGGGLRAQALLEWLASQSPDIVVTPEWQDNTPGKLLKSGLEAIGFHVATAALLKARSNGVLLATKGALQSRRITPRRSERGELLLADIAVGLRLLAAYFPQGEAKGPFFKTCIDEAVLSGATPFLLLGDLNTGRNDVDVEGNGTPFVFANLFEALQKKAGLVDLWRAEHGDKQEWSWKSSRNGFRVDHAFSNVAFQKRFPTISCAYDHSPRQIGLTDHSALVIRCAD